MAAAGVAAAFIAVLVLLPGLPDIESIQQLELKIPLRIFSGDAQLMGEYGSERRIPLRIEDAPNRLIAAILSAEDDRYYEHVGIDYRGLLRAIYANVQSGSRSQGASTITMQVARNYFLTPERTYIRKAREALLALRLEQRLTKDEIFELYLNKIFLGHRAYGFQAAASVYYGKSLEELTNAQFAMLAALPKAPSAVNPISNPETALIRRNYVLDRMFGLGYLSPASHQSAIEEPISAKLHLAEVDLKAPYVAEHIRQFMFEQYGDDVYADGYSVYATIQSKDQRAAVQGLRKGLITYDMRHGYRGAVDKLDVEAFDGDMVRLSDALKEVPFSQEIVPVVITEVTDEAAIAVTRSAEMITIPFEKIKWARKHLSSRALGSKLEKPSEALSVGDIVYARLDEQQTWTVSQIPQVGGALIAIDVHDGAVRAMVGGFDYYMNKFNRATQAVRQVGSNIKPFIYSAALENGYTAASMVSGAPVVIKDEQTDILWRPENYSGKFFGTTRLREALSRSVNLVSVRILRSIGIEPAVAHMSKFGFDREALPPGLALALGAFETTPMEVVTGYAAFANGGYVVEPYFIDFVKDRDGKVVYTGKRSEVCSVCLEEPAAAKASGSMPSVQRADRAISSANAYIMHEMLREVVKSGTARKAKSLKRSDIGGKTGTTNDFEDAWFSGFGGDVAATVWIGFDNPADLGRHEAGARAALPVWIDFMETALEGRDENLPHPPDNVVAVTIHSQTGEPVFADHPEGFTEVFMFGSEPLIATASTADTEELATVPQSVDDLF